jgi:hypothetical protein
LEESNRQKDSQIAALKLQGTVPDKTPVAVSDQGPTIKLLELKIRALLLKTQYLQWKVSHAQ